MTKLRQLSDATVRAKDKLAGYYLDGHGLYLQVSYQGSRAWILKYTILKKTREMGLGSLDDFSLTEARERARKFRQLIADGIDPIEFNREQKLQQFKIRIEAERSRRTFKAAPMTTTQTTATVGKTRNTRRNGLRR